MRWRGPVFGVVMIAVALALNAAFTRWHATMSDVSGSTTTSMANEFTLASAAFQQGDSIPSKYTCDGEGISPPLSIRNAPSGTVSFALVAEDPDIPQVFKDQLKIDAYIHWVLFNVPATSTEIAENSSAGDEGDNSSGKLGYTPPCPPKQYEPSRHRYTFYLYALDSMLPLRPGATKDELMQVMQGHIVGETELTGTYQKE